MNKVDNIIREICSKNILQKKMIDNTFKVINKYEREQLEALINVYCNQGFSIKFQSEAYLMFINDTIEEMKYFMQHKKYRYSKLEEVNDSVYTNDEYMTKYMIGLSLSTYLWINHLKIMRWFLSKIKSINCKSGSEYLEIGPGHGNFFAMAVENTKFKNFTAVDISETSVNLTKKYLDVVLNNNRNKYSVLHKDFFDLNIYKKYDAIVMGEILEHVENPLAFLKKVYELAKEDSFIYVTTVINGPEKDHIYLFRSIDEVEQIIKQGGFEIVEKICTTANDTSIEKAIKRNQCINIALIIKKI